MKMKHLKTFTQLNENTAAQREAEFIKREAEFTKTNLPKDLQHIFVKYPKLSSVTYNPYTSDGNDGYISMFHIEYAGDNIWGEFAENSPDVDMNTVNDIYVELNKLEDKYPGPEASLFGDPDKSLKIMANGTTDIVDTER